MHEIIVNLTAENLSDLHEKFKAKQRKSSKYNGSSELGLTKEKFSEALCDVLKTEEWILDILKLFDEITKTDNNQILWGEFLDFIIRSRNESVCPKLQLCEPKLYKASHTKIESIKKIVLIETEKYFCYAIISKYGRVGIYNGYMDFLTSYHVIMTREDQFRNDNERRRRNRWITDAIFLSDVNMLVVTNSTRSLTIYDTSGLKHIPVWLIIGMPNVITGLACKENIENKSILFVGDETGTISYFKFLQPQNGLLRKKHNDNLSLFYWPEIADEKKYVVFKTYKYTHKETINQITYFAEYGMLISCSKDIESSVVIYQMNSLKQRYTFKMRRGAQCFDFNKTLSVLITGSDDGTIRIWNYLMTNKPLASLNTETAGIVDIVIFETLKLFCTCARDSNFKLWDINEHNCLQNIKIAFPPFKILGSAIEWGNQCIFPGPKREPINEKPIKTLTEEIQLQTVLEVNKAKFEIKMDKVRNNNNIWDRSHIIVTCCNYIAKVRLLFSNIERVEINEAKILPTPPLQNSVLIPSNWNLSSEVSSVEKGLPLSCESVETNVNNFILDKEIFYFNFPRCNINERMAYLEDKKEKMSWIVSQGAPFLAMELPKLDEVKINPGLNIPNKKIELLAKKMTKILQSASSRSIIFSESTSTSRSLRSSIVEFD